MKPLYHFRSADARYGLTLPGDAVRHMLTEATNADGTETGGLLIGLYNDALDTAMVTRAASPPTDSVRTPTTFWRGITGVQELLQRLWTRPVRTFYLGEWHVHPGLSAQKSRTDDQTMNNPALKHAFQCAVPVLVILGGHPGSDWHLKAWAYPDRQPPVSLNEVSVEAPRSTPLG